MPVARVLSRTELGVEAPLVQVELHLGPGLPSFAIVGLPAPVVRESRERVRAALLSSGFQFPAGRIIANLAPVEMAKQGGRFDLPIALALLLASGQARPPVHAIECYGELGLGGELKPVGGLFLAALHARRAGHGVLVPAGNRDEVLASGLRQGCAATTLTQAVRYLGGGAREGALRPVGDAPPSPGWPQDERPGDERPGAAAAEGDAPPRRGLSEVVGHWQAKRALLVAAAGGHSLLLVGPPGSGKSLLAGCVPDLLPPLSAEEALEVAGIASVAGLPFDPRRWTRPPFRAPHHTASAGAIVGGGPRLRPGEISLAHRGVLFLDELPEFDWRVLESLRQPLETGCVHLARAGARLMLPARFQLVAAMNPCACGFHGDPQQPCRCTPAQLARYRGRISGPLLDRIDLRVEVPRLNAAEWGGDGQSAAAGQAGDAQADTARQVCAAREWRVARSGCLCAGMSLAQLEGCCDLPYGSRTLLQQCVERGALSGRGLQRLLAVGRTIADLARSERVQPDHLAEAVQLRRPLGG